MSKLDEIILEYVNKGIHKLPETKESIAYTKKQIKDLMYKVYDEDYYTFKNNLEEL